MSAPLWLLLAAASQPEGLGARGGMPVLPGPGIGDNFDRLRQLGDVARSGPTLGGMFRASLLSASAVAVLATAISFLAAYAMTIARVRRASLWFWITLLTLYFPIEARMLPTFEVAAGLGLINTGAGLVLPILPLALGTFVFRQHMKTLPPELLEAARLDGAGPLRFLRDFVLPLSLVPMGAVLLITFLAGWNQYLWPLMISVDNRYFTLMRGLNLLGAGSGPSLALAVVSVLPPLVLVLAFQRLIATRAAFRM